MTTTLYRLDLDQLDDNVATFAHPDRVVVYRMDREEWEQTGRPVQLHVGVTDNDRAAMNWLRIAD